jgi:heme oxygenase
VQDQTFLKRLKHLTQDEHWATEQAVDLPGRLRSRGDYLELIERFWGLYAPLEPQLVTRLEWATHDIAIEQRLKTPLLLRDLQALGLSSAGIRALPRCINLPQIDTFTAVLGCMYVLEGSTLGGQFIAREARQALGLTPEHGSAFFSSYGAHVGAMWRSFGLLLLRAAEDEASEKQIVQAACETFQVVRQWLRREGNMPLQ